MCTKKDKQCRYLILLLLTSAIDSLYAEGYRNPPPTAEAISKSGANYVFADDASAMFFNPANLGFQTNLSIVAGGTLAHTENTFTHTTGIKIDADDPWQMLPNIFASTPLGQSKFAAGIAITTPYGQSIEWDRSDILAITPPFNVPIYEARIMLADINPTIAFKISDQVAIGAGLDIFASTLEFDAAFGPAKADVDADGVGIGANIGIAVNITDNQRLALTYRSPVKVNYEGDLDTTGVGPFVSDAFDMDIKYPTIIGIGYGIELFDDRLKLEANLEWLEWSLNDTQTADLGVNGKLHLVNKWDNTCTFSIGGEWQFAENWVFRTGYAFLESPIPDETISPLLPDADRHVLSFGLSYTYKHHTLDIAYSFSFYEERDNRANTLSAYPGKYDIDSDLLGLTYSMIF